MKTFFDFSIDASNNKYYWEWLPKIEHFGKNFSAMGLSFKWGYLRLELNIWNVPASEAKHASIQ